jgi:RimJ/RimL family protein N-acetyltransferase
MKTLVINDRARVSAWVAGMVGSKTTWADDPAIGLDRNGELVAGAVLHGVTIGARASITWACNDRFALTKDFIVAMFDYPFRLLDVRVLFGQVKGNNLASINFAKKLGCKEIARFKEAWDGKEDLVLFSLHRDDCRWLRLGGN